MWRYLVACTAATWLHYLASQLALKPRTRDLTGDKASPLPTTRVCLIDWSFCLRHDASGWWICTVVSITFNRGIISRSWVLLDKLIVARLVKIFPTFHGTRKFIIIFKTVRHWILSWASPIHSKHWNNISIKCIVIPSTPLSLKWSLYIGQSRASYAFHISPRLAHLFSFWQSEHCNTDFCRLLLPSSAHIRN